MVAEFEYPKDAKKFDKFIADNPEHHIWHDVPAGVMRVYTGDDIPTQSE